MDSLPVWILKKAYYLKYIVLGFPEDNLDPLPLWSLESPFKMWNIYSKASFAASIICFVIFLCLHIRRRPTCSEISVARRTSAHKLKVWVEYDQPLLHTWLHTFTLFLVICLFISIPWEWVRLYQIEVAKKTTVLSEGYAKSCYSQDLSLWETVKVWLSWNFSWNSNFCEDYYKALIVDPFWEVTPLMAISSAIGRLIVHPLELLSHMVGRILRNIMKEIPSHWQLLVFLLIPLTCITILGVAYFRRKDTTYIPCHEMGITTRSKSIKVAARRKTKL
ncbi:chloride channel CLIC-like protein 1 [Rhinophrynus dorsalis]